MTRPYGILTLIATLLMAGPASTQNTPPPAPNTILSFVDCLNGVAEQNDNQAADISTTVQCLPANCTWTLTMSAESAQAACFLGGVQLPRLIFNCPPPCPGGSCGSGLNFRPSYLFCPILSKSDGNFGVDRVELGQDVTGDDIAGNPIPAGTMIMADVPLPPTANFTGFNPADVYSDATGDNRGSKACNACHGTTLLGATLAPDGTIGGQSGLEVQLSPPLPTFGGGNNTFYTPQTAATFVMFSNDPEVLANLPGPLNANGANLNALSTQGVVSQTLPQLCGCINQNLNAIRNDRGYQAALAQGNAESDLSVLTNLCSALLPKLDLQASACVTQKKKKG